MPVWAVIVIVLAVAVAFVVAAWLLSRNKGVSVETLKELQASTATRLQEELEAERQRTQAVAAEVTQLAEAHRKLTAWYTDRVAELDQEAKDAYAKLAVDPDAVDRKLDELLGTGSASSTAGPKEPAGEG